MAFPPIRAGLCLAVGSGTLLGQEEAGLKELQKFLDTPVTVATKDPVSMAEAPAIVTVITRNDLIQSGARSVAEALARVPGLYAIDDYVSPNLGVRGINGGQRAYGRIVKVLLDGQPMEFLSDSAHGLGPELIPIEAVDRIEIVRGPASALYGANAFLGVVNILTRAGGQGEAQSLLGRVQRQGDRWGEGLEAFLSGGGGAFGGMLTGSGARLDRSGQILPPSSPLLLNSVPPDTQSRNDLSQPRSLYGRGWFQAAPGLRLELQSHYSRLDAIGEWLDFGFLRHDNRVVLEQGFTRLSAQWQARPGLRVNAYAAHSWGQPGAEERLDGDSAAVRPRRDIGFHDLQAGLEALWTLSERANLAVGVDVNEDHERLMKVFGVNVATATQTLLSPDVGEADFRNRGAYLQASLRPLPRLGLVLNLRRDWPNRFEAVTSTRAGATSEFTDTLSGKLLYGTAFKAPSAFQFYGQPLYAGDVVGNPGLRPERSATWEAELRWRPWPVLVLNLNGYRNRVTDKVELVPFGTGSQPINQGPQASTGLEGEGRFTSGAHLFYANVAWQRSEDIQTDPFLGELRAPTTLYPGLTGLLQWRWTPAGWGGFDAALHYVGERRASKSNIQRNYYRAYALGAYSTVDVTWTGTWGPHRLQGQIRNLFDRSYTEPGFRGLDVPGRPREWGVAYAFAF